MRDSQQLLFSVDSSLQRRVPVLVTSVGPILAVSTAVVCASVLIGLGRPLGPLVVVGICLALWLAWRVPLAAGILWLLVQASYMLLQMTPSFDSEAFRLHGMNPADVLALAMIAAVLVRLVSGPSRRTDARLLRPTILFTVWLLLEIVRNVPAFGLSAFGEFRGSYLVLAVPLFLSTSLRSQQLVRTALHLFVWVAVVLPISFAPVVLYLNGWSFGPSTAMYPASVSLGLLSGLIVLWQCRDWVRWPRPVLYACSLLAAGEIVIDGHRSVWLATIAALSVLWLTHRSLRRWIHRLAILLATAVGATLIALVSSVNLWSIISQEGGAALTLEGTASWRIAVWKASVQYFTQSPFAGRGLGRYWETYVPEFGRVTEISPHSLYVVLLVHLGVIGVLCLSWVVFSVCRTLYRGMTMSERATASGHLAVSEPALVGLMILAAIAGFGVGYAFESYTMALLGICLAAVMNAREPSASVRRHVNVNRERGLE